MPIYYHELYDAVVIFKETEGRGTFDVTWPDGREQSLCLNPMKGHESIDGLCSKKAGHGTIYKTVGLCFFHGGTRDHKVASNPTRYQLATRRSLRRHMEVLEEDTNIRDLTPELILMRATLRTYLEQNPEITSGAVQNISGLINNISMLVDRIDRIEVRNVLTLSSVRLLMARGVDIASNYLDPEALVEFIQSWRDDVQGPLQLNGRGSELDVVDYDKVEKLVPLLESSEE